MLKLIDEYQPEIIFLEASGLSDPISIAELLQTSELKNKVTLDKNICLIDAPNFHNGLKTLVRFKHQIMIADTVIINKTDIFKGNMEDLVQEIKKLNPFANIVQTTYANMKWHEFEIIEDKKGRAARRFIGKQSEGKPPINACVLRTHKRINESQLKNFISELQPDCPRIKGYLNLEDGRFVSIQSVYKNLEIKEINNYTGPSELIAFGHQLEISYLRNTWLKFASQ